MPLSRGRTPLLLKKKRSRRLSHPLGHLSLLGLAFCFFPIGTTHITLWCGVKVCLITTMVS